MKRVVVTGLGVVSPIGQTIPVFWSSLQEGRCGIGPITGIPTERLGVKIAAEIASFRPTDHFEPRRLGMLDRVSQFAVVAAREAVRQSGAPFADGLGERTATIVGSGVGGMSTLDDSFHKLYAENAARVHPFTIPRLMANAPASHITMDLRLTGPTFVIASACASATHAIGQAFQMVRTGMVEAAVAGGAEACITIGGMKGWEAMRVLSNEACRPFSRNRNGLSLGEGAAMLVLESLEAARARGAEILAEIVGCGMSADARDITAPDVGGAARAITGALADAGLAPDDIDYINAHGTGTTANDQTETAAIRKAFGASADRLAVSSSKSMFGHALGAAGALELAATVLALRHGVVPPTINYTDPDPLCDLDYVPNQARQQTIRAALSNSFAFGGLNAVLAVKRFDG
ncbi:MAG: beta-ketoacyl-ACP synthase II [Azospirillum sp.]|nr:beta-ketoacyl-ACP synthase II [Azospirillum sp.]